MEWETNSEKLAMEEERREEKHHRAKGGPVAWDIYNVTVGE